MVTIYSNTELNFPQSVLETCIKLTRRNALGFWLLHESEHPCGNAWFLYQ